MAVTKETEKKADLLELPEWYRFDPIVEACLRMIAGGEARGREQYGAVLMSPTGEIMALARNMLVYKGEPWRRQGYANHSEAMAIFAADVLGYDPRGFTVFVSGLLADGRPFVHGPGEELRFTCTRCSKVFLEYGVAVAVPTQTGWVALSPEQAAKTAGERAGGRKVGLGRGSEALKIGRETGKKLRARIVGTSPIETAEKLTTAGFGLSPYAQAVLDMSENGFLPEKQFKNHLKEVGARMRN
ncbi:MAG: hypothetical protein WAV56_03665 [Microgenomates group bacterium]